MTTIDKNVKKCKKCQKQAKNVFLARNYPKNGTSRFHTMFGSKDTNFGPFLAKIGIFGSKLQPNIFTAKPMVVGCVQHYSTHFINKLETSIEPFFRKVQKTAKNG